MTLVPASSHGGGGLPPQWTVSSLGELTIAPDSDAGHDFVCLRVIAPASFDGVDVMRLESHDGTVQAVGLRDVDQGIAVHDSSGSIGQSPIGSAQMTRAITAVGASLAAITAGALPTVALVTATAAQLSTTRDVDSVTPVTFNPGAATTATCKVELSPDNVTFSTLGIETEPVGVALDGTIHLINAHVPAGWYLKLTVTNAVLGTTTYY